MYRAAVLLIVVLTGCGAPAVAPVEPSGGCPPRSTLRADGLCECDDGAAPLPDGGWECAAGESAAG